MEDFPEGGLIGKTVHLWRNIRQLQVPLYAANASFFLVLSVFPGLLLLLGLLWYTPLEVERLGELLAGFLPDVLLESAEELVLLTYDNSSGLALGISAVTALWSASRGLYGIIGGLNRVYGVEESRKYLHIRLLSVVYTFIFLLVLILTLGLHVFGTRLLCFLKRSAHPFVGFLLELVDLRFLPLLFVQTGIFILMYGALPNQKPAFRKSLPGALLASLGWLIFSDLYSIYVSYASTLANVYGSVYGVALSMLWLYCCMAIVFYGGVVNRIFGKCGKTVNF